MAIYSDWTGAQAGSPAARAVARYNELIKQIADRARQPGFDPAGWSELEEVVAVTEFRRFGNFMETQSWSEYLAMLHQWGSTTSFSSTFRRMTDEQNLVFLELQENNGGHIVNSLSLYELDSSMKIARLHIYLQMAPPAAPAN